MDSTNNPPATDVYAFGQFRLLASERLLTRAGEPIKLGSRAFDILHVLVSAFTSQPCARLSTAIAAPATS
jgi:DNA-binding response OmpR family regulator